MIAVDTNVLVYAEMKATRHHARALELVTSLAEGEAQWAIPWPCLYEFLRVVTHPRVFRPPMALDDARADLRALLGSPSVVLLSETDRHAEILDELLAGSRATGNLVHDVHVAALCREHGVRELLTADVDFGRFKGLRVRNPFAG
ncbi:MAG TPA: TA system VapC family ribonuclease toxin [Anaeromyxobacteraceae bacterium]|nr:TA system VapC family ribonuclease toxin [Anaeromyxobacteraceae bacterium]